MWYLQVLTIYILCVIGNSGEWETWDLGLVNTAPAVNCTDSQSLGLLISEAVNSDGSYTMFLGAFGLYSSAWGMPDLRTWSPFYDKETVIFPSRPLAHS